MTRMTQIFKDRSCISALSAPSAVNLVGSEDPQIMPDAHRAHSYIKNGEPDPKEREPREHHVTRIQLAYEFIDLKLRRVLRDLIEASADEVTQGMTAERVRAEQEHVEREHQASN